MEAAVVSSTTQRRDGINRSRVNRLWSATLLQSRPLIKARASRGPSGPPSSSNCDPSTWAVAGQHSTVIVPVYCVSRNGGWLIIKQIDWVVALTFVAEWRTTSKGFRLRSTVFYDSRKTAYAVYTYIHVSSITAGNEEPTHTRTVPDTQSACRPRPRLVFHVPFASIWPRTTVLSAAQLIIY